MHKNVRNERIKNQLPKKEVRRSEARWPRVSCFLFGTAGWLLLGRTHLPIRRGMLLQKKCRHLLAQEAGQVFAFSERYQLVLVRLREHALERLAGAE